MDLDAPAAPRHLIVVHLRRSQDVIGEVHGGLRLTCFSRAGLKIIPAGRSSEWHWRAPRRPSDSLHIHLDPAVLGRAAASTGQDPAAVELLDYFGELDPQIESIGAAFQHELALGGAAEELYADALATSLAVMLLRRHTSRGAGSGHGVGGQPAGGLSARALRTATDYVEANLRSQDISVGDIAAATGLSAHHFARLFRATTGTAPHQYVIERRVQRARTLLETTDRPLSEVAMRCGFTHQAHMTRHFHRLVGTTPGRYRLR